MDTRLLIDSIMRQTTVLIAQLSSAAGVRAPLAHLADEVFLSLSTELEAQGLSRKVVADMFGLALRGYQRRVQRLRESATDQGRTLWRAVLEHVQKEQRVSRRRLFERFANDDANAVGAVVSDLVANGLLYKTGSGTSAVYGATPDEDRAALARADRAETLAALVWLEVCRRPSATADEVATTLAVPVEHVEHALKQLAQQGRLRDVDGVRSVEPLIIPVGAEAGWEAAVFDHYQALCRAIATKLRVGRARSAAGDTVGGATLGFEIAEGHPLEAEVLGLLTRVRTEVGELWQKVEAHNAAHPIAEDKLRRVTFYFGQHLQDAEDDEPREEQP